MNQALFLWIVRVINEALGMGAKSLPFIGVLDIFGERSPLTPVAAGAEGRTKVGPVAAMVDACRFAFLVYCFYVAQCLLVSSSLSLRAVLAGRLCLQVAAGIRSPLQRATTWAARILVTISYASRGGH